MNKIRFLQEVPKSSVHKLSKKMVISCVHELMPIFGVINQSFVPMQAAGLEYCHLFNPNRAL